MKKYLFLCLIVLFWSCSDSEPTEKRINGNALGTTFQIIYYDSLEEEDLDKAMDSLFKTVNNSLSTYQSDSDISKINAGDSSVVVDEMFAEVFQLSKKIYDESSGYFDPTVGNLVNAYGFGSKQFSTAVDSTLVDSLSTFVGLNHVKLNTDKTISKSISGVYLEFNSIAKGYCLDRISDYLKNHDINNYLIELGGELVASGSKQPKNTLWVAGIEEPLEDGSRAIAKTVKLKDIAMATSGNYRKFKLDSLTGQKYVHTINPLTGYPEQNDMLSASVFAQTCAEADAYATTFMTLGFKKSKQLLDKLQNVDAYLMYLNGNNEIEVFVTKGIEPYIN
jgi:thiamine biosynthesis lipoprotein